jgi:hypothetical protein
MRLRAIRTRAADLSERAQGEGGGNEVLRRPFRGRDRRGLERVIADRAARLEPGQGVAQARDDADPPPVGEIVAGLPDKLSQIIQKCLNKDRRGRYQANRRCKARARRS